MTITLAESILPCGAPERRLLHCLMLLPSAQGMVFWSRAERLPRDIQNYVVWRESVKRRQQTSVF